MRCIGVMVASALLCLSVHAQADILVTVSKSQQRLAVVIDGQEVYRWPVSTGTRGHETPSGSFRPHDLQRHWYSRQYSLTPMPWAVFFHNGYAVHATAETYNLGRPASHGCVRLRPDNASILYSLVRRQGMHRTKVVVQNGPLPVPPGAVPMADAQVGEQFAAATDADSEVFAAKSREVSVATDDDLSQVRAVHAVVYRVSVGSNEKKILREREAWLKSLDRKYGITR